MIQYARKEHRSALMKMWKLCFEDTDDFIRFYFNVVFRDNETLILTNKKNKEPIASLQMIPYQLKTGTKTYAAAYISGAMTHPDYRRKGLMNELLHVAFEELRKKNIPLSFLIPQEKWLFGFYERFGYHAAFPFSIENVELLSGDALSTSGNISVFSSPGQWMKDLYPAYYQFLSVHENVILKSEQQFCNFLEDLFIDRGKVFVAGGNEGIAFAVPYKTGVIVKEYFYKSKEINFSLLSAVKETFNASGIKCLNRVYQPDSRLYGMIKIIDTRFFSEKLPSDIYISMMLD
jgi:GNAT superfamily N-acetyltransferase